MNFVAGILLLYLDPELAFRALECLMSRVGLRTVFMPGLPGLQVCAVLAGDRGALLPPPPLPPDRRSRALRTPRGDTPHARNFLPTLDSSCPASTTPDVHGARNTGCSWFLLNSGCIGSLDQHGQPSPGSEAWKRFAVQQNPITLPSHPVCTATSTKEPQRPLRTLSACVFGIMARNSISTHPTRPRQAP